MTFLRRQTHVAMVAAGLLLNLACYELAAGQAPSPDRKTFTTSGPLENSTSTILHTDHGDKGIEVKVEDKKGNVTQWYQSYFDTQGREIIYICRVVPGVNKPPYEGIQTITAYAYNLDGNVTDEFQFFGDGTLRHHILYKYDSQGKWLEGDQYGPTGKPQGVITTPPQNHLYGKQ